MSRALGHGGRRAPNGPPVIAALVLAIVGTISSSCTQDAPTSIAQRSAPLAGTLAAECEWPSAFAGICSSMLIHPRVALASGHCLSAPGRYTMRFGEHRDPARATVDATCSRVAGVDMTVCVLDHDAPAPFVPPAVGCELMGLGDGAWMAGYGQTLLDGGVVPTGDKRVSPMHVDRASAGTFQVSGARVGLGDSGSPIYVPAPDGTWRTLGVILDSDFNTRGYGVLIAPHLAAIETLSGFDVTPCTTAAGAWSPGPACGGFARTTSRGMGTWALGCRFDVDTRFSASCGAPFAATDGGIAGGLDAAVLRDAGGAPSDAGVALRDAGVALGDAGVALRDAGVALRDAGTTSLDAGAARRDAGNLAEDSGAAAVDAATMALNDAGAHRDEDAGAPPNDAAGRSDAAVHGDAALAVRDAGDVASPDAAVDGHEIAGGCACGVARSAGSVPMLGEAFGCLVLVMAARRRRRRSPTAPKS